MAAVGTLNAPARWLAALLILVAATTLFLGFDKSDVRPAEARLLLSARSGAVYPALMGHMRSMAPHLSEPALGRLVGSLFLLAAGVVLFAWLDRVSGGAAAVAGALAVATAGPMPLLATQVSLAPPLVLLATVALVGLYLCIRGRLAVGAALVLISGTSFVGLARTLELPTWVDGAADRGLGPLYAIVAGLPWSAAWMLVLSRGFRSRLADEEKCAAFAAAGIGAQALVASVWQPEFWLGASFVVVIASAVPLSFAWKHWYRHAAGFENRLLGTLVLGIPLAALGLACVRIGLYHQQMEKVQAIAVTGIVGLFVAAAAVRMRWPTVAWIPILAVAVVGKVVYLGAFVPEWNARWSSKDNALAIARNLPRGSELFTDIPVDPSFEYYIGAPIHGLTDLEQASADRTRLALVPLVQLEVLTTRTGRPWEVVRRFEWSSAGPVCLARESASRLDGTAAADRDAGKR